MYLDFLHEEPFFHEEYNLFLHLMKEFKSGKMDTVDVMQGVQFLFDRKEHLLAPFTLFLPPGYSFTFGQNATLSKIITPEGVTALASRPPRDNIGLRQFMQTVILSRRNGHTTLNAEGDDVRYEGESGYGTYRVMKADIGYNDVESTEDTEIDDDNEWETEDGSCYGDDMDFDDEL
jgi:hypothetical protein